MLTHLFWPGVAFVATCVAAFGFRVALFAGFRRWTGTPESDSGFLRASRVPSLLWCVVLGLVAAIQDDLTMSRRLAERLGMVLQAAVVLSVTITLAGGLASVVAAASERKSMGGGVTGLADGIDIPFPTRTVDLRTNGAGDQPG